MHFFQLLYYRERMGCIVTKNESFHSSIVLSRDLLGVSLFTLSYRSDPIAYFKEFKGFKWTKLSHTATLAIQQGSWVSGPVCLSVIVFLNELAKESDDSKEHRKLQDRRKSVCECLPSLYGRIKLLIYRNNSHKLIEWWQNFHFQLNCSLTSNGESVFVSVRVFSLCD